MKLMKLILYKNKAESNRLDKTDYLEKIYELEGTLRDKCSIISPIIQVQLVELTKICQCNYAYIADFGRYYYIDDVVGEYNSIVTLYMRSDPLMSFKDPILDLDVVALRNEYNSNAYIEDKKIPVLLKPKLFIQKYNSSLPWSDSVANGYNFILTVTSEEMRTSADKWVSYDNNSGITNSGMSIYIFTKSNLNNFIKNLYSTNDIKLLVANNPSEAIINIYYSPIDLSSINNFTNKFEQVISSSGELAIPLGNTSIKCGNTPIYIYSRTTSSIWDVLLVEDLVLNNEDLFVSKSFLDYEPYTKYELFIPYIGNVDINATLLFEYKYIHLYYSIDLMSGLINVGLYVNNSQTLLRGDTLISTYSNKLLVNVPVTQTNNADFLRGCASFALNSMFKLGAMAGGFGGSGSALPSQSVKSSGYEGVFFKQKDRDLLEKTPSITNVNTEKNVNIVGSSLSSAISILGQHIGVTSGNGDLSSTFLINYKIPYILQHNITKYKVNGYGKLIGFPSSYSGKLSGLYGYTEIGSVHIEFNQLNYSPLTEELKEIDNTMRSGIILPDKPTS